MSRNTYIALAVAVIAAVAIFNLPRTPYQEPAVEEREEVSTLDVKVDEAVAIIQSGEGAPMAAIGMLLDVLREDPNHEKALMWLGNFSMMSGQWDKAVDRFHQLSQLHPENEMYTLNKAQALLQTGDTTKALEVANEYINTYPDADRVKDLAEGL
ncbi:MAG: Beta-barrel assembly-enhancing protease [Cryomorphaceae bacterium]|nr:MAG: Beta-barrel assembly-enhancing protease [Cryomorphaceae bacterium]